MNAQTHSGHDHGAPSHDHDHSHHHDGAGGMTRLAIALAIIATFAAVEVVGGLLAGSLALLADAGHMVTDAAALVLALFAQWIGKRPSSERFPFGLKRAQVLAAFINGLGLVVLVGVLLGEAIERLGDPQEIDTGLMLTVAVIGLAANVAAFAVLHMGATDDVNVKGALLHVAADLFGSVAAIVSALIIKATGFLAVDAILTMVVCLLILRSSIPLIRETGSILLQAAPPGLDVEELRKALIANPSILDIHHVRAWQLTPSDPMIALHAVVPAHGNPEEVLRFVKDTLRERFSIGHSTVQIEFGAGSQAASWCGCPDAIEATL
ncbi:MAG: cation diffusion facilitator family transporter [Parvularcula sp.]|jgi:cobalt-zinc-cadmium efflux system protein|nr:cation diffusion facilitator family transporter [Parvularcula sp.]